MSSLARKITTAGRVLQTDGVSRFASVAWEKIQMWWRRDDRLGLSYFTGTPNRLVRLDGARFTTGDSPSLGNLRELLLRGLYEKPEREALEKYLDATLPVVEFGGCIGVVSCLTNKKLCEPKRHVVIEANPDLLSLLKENRDRNGCRFEVLHRAVSYGGASVVFHIDDNVLASNVQFATSRPVAVPATTLRSILDERGFARCTLICDIEGGEVELVERETDVLRERVATMIVEVHRSRLGEAPVEKMFETLEEIGFARFFLDEETYVFQNRHLAPESRGVRATGMAAV